MKTKLFLLMGLISHFCFGQISSANLVAYYNFENSGANQINSNLYGLTPQNTNAGGVPSFTSDGISGSCVNFNGSNTLVNDAQLADYFAAQSDKSVTISFWMKSDFVQDGLKTYVEGFESIVVRGRVPGFLVSRSAGNYQGGAASDLNGDLFFADTNVWNHIVYIYNASANTLRGYINNVLWVNIALTGSEQAPLQYTNKFLVGAGTNDGVVNWPQKAYSGKIDEMYVFSRAITTSEVQSLYNLQTPQFDCPSGSVTLNTQTEVNNFIAEYPNCTTIDGDFTLNGSTITDLSGLNAITAINGGLTIQNTALTSLNGFQNLNSINGIEISNNPNLTSIANLLQLNTAVYQISISNNPQLTSLFGLNGITSTTSLHLVQLPLVSSLQPLSGLGGFLPFVYIASLPIQNLTGLNQVTTSSTFNIVNLPNLNSLQGLNQLTNIVFPSPRGNDNDYPQEVLGFGYGLSITNTAIANLDELSNLTNMNGTNLSIVNNPNLISLTGLTNLIPTSVGYLEILNNTLLSNCATATICSILENIDENSVFIEVNDTGCDSVIEVENACEALSTSDFNLTNDIKIYPNPFNNQISIALGGDYQNVKTTLADVTGKQFYSKTFTGNTIEINQLDSLSSGMYFVTVELENGKTITQKIVK